MEPAFWLHFAKRLHIGGLILWLGPSGGAWLLLQMAKRRLNPQGAEYRALYRDFLPFFWVEHFGLSLLLASGIWLLGLYGVAALDRTWLRIKLALVLCVIVPIEILDIWFGHVRLPRHPGRCVPSPADVSQKGRGRGGPWMSGAGGKMSAPIHAPLRWRRERNVILPVGHHAPGAPADLP